MGCWRKPGGLVGNDLLQLTCAEVPRILVCSCVMRSGQNQLLYRSYGSPLGPVPWLGLQKPGILCQQESGEGRRSVSHTFALVFSNAQLREFPYAGVPAQLRAKPAAGAQWYSHEGKMEGIPLWRAIGHWPEEPCQFIVCIALLVMVDICVKGCEGSWRVVWMAALLKLGGNH